MQWLPIPHMNMYEFTVAGFNQDYCGNNYVPCRAWDTRQHYYCIISKLMSPPWHITSWYREWYNFKALLLSTSGTCRILTPVQKYTPVAKLFSPNASIRFKRLNHKNMYKFTDAGFNQDYCGNNYVPCRAWDTRQHYYCIISKLMSPPWHITSWYREWYNSKELLLSTSGPCRIYTRAEIYTGGKTIFSKRKHQVQKVEP